MKSIERTAICALCLVAGSLTALAEPVYERRVVVKFYDRELESVTGRAAFMDRLHAAAVEVCGRQPSEFRYDYMRRRDTCVTNAMHRAIASLPEPRVERYAVLAAQEAGYQ